MADAGAIRAGQTYIEISADDAKLQTGLAAAQSRIQKWASAQAGIQSSVAAQAQGAAAGSAAGPGGVLDEGVSFKWAQRVARGAGVGILAHSVGAAMSGLAALLKGEWEGVGKAIEGVPILGGAATSLANGFDDLFLGIRAGMKRMREEALKGLKYTQSVMDAVAREVAVKSETAAIGANPFNRKLMDIDDKALRDALAEYKKAFDAGGITPANRGVLSAIEERRKKEKAAAFGEQSLSAGNAQLTGIVAVQERASQEARKWEDTLFNLTQQLAKARGATDALAAEEATAKRNLAKELAAGTITSGQYRARLMELSQTYEELALAAEGEKQDAAKAAAKAEGEALAKSVRTPEERARAEIDQYKALLASGDITSGTYDLAVRKALEDAARAMPDVARQTIGVRGTFNAMEAAGMGGGGVADEMLDAQRKTARNTEKIAQLAANLGVTFS